MIQILKLSCYKKILSDFINSEKREKNLKQTSILSYFNKTSNIN